MWLPGKRYQCSDVCRSAQISCEGLRGGMNRAVDDIDESWLAKAGDSAEYRWKTPVKLQNTRLVFDSFLNRPEKNIIVLQCKNVPLCTTPVTLVKRFKLDYQDAAGVWHELGEFSNPGQRLCKLPLDIECVALKLTILETFGNESVKVFSWTVK